MNTRTSKGLALTALACVFGQASAIFGISTGPGSTEVGFSTVGQVNGGGGVVFAPHWVASASHLGLGDFVLNGVTYHPDIHVTQSAYDTTLYHFSAAFSDFTPLYSGSPVGQEVTMVGYGFSGTQRADHLGYTLAGASGIKRSATNTIGQVGNFSKNGGLFYYMIADLDTADAATPPPYTRDNLGDGGPTTNEGGVAGGDSGGGFFINDGGVQKLAGVTNFSWFDDSAPTDQGAQSLLYGYGGSGAADFSEGPVRDWIDRTIAPEPATTALIGGAFLGLLAMRRRA